METYITVHDQDLLLACEASGQFAELESHTYLFVGPRPTTKVPLDVSMIVARDYTPNFEHLPDFYDFTGWWVLAHHDLIAESTICTMQYDMRPGPRFAEVTPTLDQHPMVAFVDGHASAGNWMLGLDGFRADFDAGLAVKGMTQDDWPPFDAWPSTQGTAWWSGAFEAYMDWFTPLFDVWAGNRWAGHLAERTVKAWLVDTRAIYATVHGATIHQASDCHGTGALMAGGEAIWADRQTTFGK